MRRIASIILFTLATAGCANSSTDSFTSAPLSSYNDLTPELCEYTTLTGDFFMADADSCAVQCSFNFVGNYSPETFAGESSYLITHQLALAEWHEGMSETRTGYCGDVLSSTEYQHDTLLTVSCDSYGLCNLYSIHDSGDTLHQEEELPLLVEQLSHIIPIELSELCFKSEHQGKVLRFNNNDTTLICY
ncbi:hypothetical protein AB4254_08480 [Vibrio breoganii]